MNAVIQRFVLAGLFAVMAWCALAGAHTDARTGTELVRTHTQSHRQFIPGGLVLPQASSHVVAVVRRTAEPSA